MKIVVVGAGYAGLMAALRVASHSRGRATVMLIDRTDRFVERIRLHQLAAGQPLPEVPLREFCAPAGVEFVQAQVEEIDVDRRTVRLHHGGGGSTVKYDRLILATGSGDNRHAVPGASAFTLPVATASGAFAIRNAFRALPRGARVVVCGAGYTGIETATELAGARGDVAVTLLGGAAADTVLGGRGARWLGEEFRRKGIELREGVVTSVSAREIHLASGERIPFDLAVWAGGFSVSDLAERSTLFTSDAGRLRVDATLRAHGHPEIYGIGDMAIVDGPIPPRMTCAAAMPMGAHAADNLLRELAGERVEPFRYAAPITCLSIGRRAGLVQFRDDRDRPTERAITGRLGAWIKEFICRYTVWMLRLEARGFRAYSWTKPAAAAGADGALAAVS